MRLLTSAAVLCGVAGLASAQTSTPVMPATPAPMMMPGTVMSSATPMTRTGFFGRRTMRTTPMAQPMMTDTMVKPASAMMPMQTEPKPTETPKAMPSTAKPMTTTPTATAPATTTVTSTPPMASVEASPSTRTRGRLFSRIFRR